MEQFISLILSNFTLSCMLFGFAVSAIVVWRSSETSNKPFVIDTFSRHFFIFAIGIALLYNFMMHVFFGEMTASFIGWDPSPFQTEVGMASLGFAVAGFIAAKKGLGMRLVALTGPAIFLLGAAGGHIFQMVEAGNFSPGNAGSVFYTDIFLPVTGFALLWLQNRNPVVQSHSSG